MKTFVGILIFNVFLAVTGYVLKSLINEELRWPLVFLSFLLTLFIIYRLMKLRVFYFENNGVIFSIKYHHPLKKSIIYPVVEYPVNRLRTFKRVQLLFSDMFIIEVGSNEKDSPKRIKIKVSGLSSRDYLDIINSLS
ncbi:hypothetical protein [Chryseobacterium sp. ISL-6]|uniref:hypothetical protein n=1 Tax=Chryseobacterium sp. ISL-6 TaxID=2819143 RepID=UPI001BEC24F9|nr:hypothetical protein [Chryseobacterium sp. ISL-6]MBT2621936.1 hypothetical protein [Chryseobacterium sp. ISL-6]